MSDLRKLSEAEWADTPGRPEYIRAATECYSQYRDGSLIPRSEYERVLALLAEAREALKEAREELEEYEADATGEGYNRPSLNATLSRIDDALAAEPEAKS